MRSTSSTELTAQREAVGWLEHAPSGISYYYLTSLIVLLGVNVGVGLPSGAMGARQAIEGDWVERLCHGNARQYVAIAERGYEYRADPLTVAFFPALPTLAALLAWATGLRAAAAVVIVSHAALAATFILTAAYVRLRWPGGRPHLAAWTLLALGLLPNTFILRMAYSESLFLLAATATLYAIERRWPIGVVAAIVGFATATRPVGVALLLPLAIYAWQSAESRAARLVRLLWLPIACWGLAGFMLYQWLAFGDALAFVHSHIEWGGRTRPLPVASKLVVLLTLEPLWGVFVLGHPGYWARYGANPLFNLQTANPIFFILSVAAVALGAWRRWLNAAEWTLGAALLLIPYALRAQEMHGGELARFAAAVLPAYFVLGHLLARIPPPLAAALCALAALMLGIYSALFAGALPLY